MTLQLREGAYYRDGEGNVVGPVRVRLSISGLYPFVAGIVTLAGVTTLGNGEYVYTKEGVWDISIPTPHDLVCEVVQAAPGAPWVDVLPSGAGLGAITSITIPAGAIDPGTLITGLNTWVESAGQSVEGCAPAHNCYSAGHVWVDTGTLRSWCRHCQANAEWSREHAMFFPTGKHEVK